MSDSNSTNPPSGATDKRDWEYTDLQSQQLMQEAEQNRHSANAILDQRAREVEALLKLLAEGGTFRSVPSPSGNFTLTRVG
jgi:hypothetical protein